MVDRCVRVNALQWRGGFRKKGLKVVIELCTFSTGSRYCANSSFFPKKHLNGKETLKSKIMSRKFYQMTNMTVSR